MICVLKSYVICNSVNLYFLHSRTPVSHLSVCSSDQVLCHSFLYDLVFLSVDECAVPRGIIYGRIYVTGRGSVIRSISRAVSVRASDYEYRPFI